MLKTSLRMREYLPRSFVQWLALPGIPACALVATVLALELVRAVYGATVPSLFSIAFLSLIAGAAQLVTLRADLDRGPAPRGIVGDALDFLALRRWDPPVIASAVCLLLLTTTWFSLGNRWFFLAFVARGTRAFASSDVRDTLDRGAAMFQHVFISGAPLLALFHLLSRRITQRRWLAWLLVPPFFVAVCVGVVISVTLAHFSH